ncbi:MAG: hypothetical protein HYY50_04830 [Candidatus Kerfeldbacteria bacterium]|nr:hypothetical protein [Candidatus Kerfeldbacteria bacterium]
MKSKVAETRQKIHIWTVAPVALLIFGAGILAAGGFLVWKNIFVTEKQTLSTFQSLTTELLKLNEEYKKATASAKPGKLNQLRLLAERRKNAALSLVKHDPTSFLRTSLNDSQQRSLPAAVQSFVEKKRTVRGQFGIGHTDNFRLGVATYFYAVKAEGHEDSFRIYFAGPIPNIQPGTVVEVTGLQLDDTMTLPVGNTESPSTQGSLGLQVIGEPIQSLAAVGTKRVAVLMFTYPGRGQPVSTSQMNGYMFTNSNSVKQYYLDASNGQLTLTGEVYGYYTTTFNTTNCSYGPLDAPGVDLNSYDKVVYYTPMPSGCYSGVGGATLINAKNIRIYDLWSGQEVLVLGHELGHAFGVNHSGSITCRDGSGNKQPIGGTCTTSEYGDSLEVMGNSNPGLMHAYHRDQLSWFQASHTQDVGSNNDCPAVQPCTIEPLGAPGTGLKTLRIPRNVNSGGQITYYHLEYRQPFPPFDNYAPTDPNVNGVQIRLSNYMATTPPNLSNLIDADVAVSGNIALGSSQTFTDADNGIAITTQSVTTSNAQVNVALSNCTHRAPRIFKKYSFQAIPTTGGTVGFRMLNADSLACDPAKFTITPTMPSGWSVSPEKLTVSVPALTQQNVAFTVITPSDIATGFYSFSVGVANAEDTTLQGSVVQIIDVDGAYDASHNPAVTIASPVAGQTVGTPSTVTISTSATAPIPTLQSLDVYVDGAPLQTCLADTCTASWRVPRVLGPHIIAVMANTTGGYVGTAAVNVRSGRITLPE